jgi:hypothetical protein
VDALVAIGTVALVVLLIAGSIALVLAMLSWAIRRNGLYELTIRGFEAERVPGDAIVFVGTSTFRLWETLARDFAPWPAVNRGFGGAVVSQAVHFAPRLVPREPAPRAIVFYCGANDLAWGVRVETVVRGVERFLAIARERAPSATIYLVSVTRSPARFLSWRRVDRANERLRELAARTGARWIDVDSALAADGKRDLFLLDGIHPSPRGYTVWTKILREHFERDLAEPSRLGASAEAPSFTASGRSA